MRLVRMTAVGLAVLLASCAQQSPPAAVSYFPPSFSIYDTDAWLGAGVSGPDIAAWQDIGATPTDARYWVSRGINPAELTPYLSSSVKVSDYQALRQKLPPELLAPPRPATVVRPQAVHRLKTSSHAASPPPPTAPGGAPDTNHYYRSTDGSKVHSPTYAPSSSYGPETAICEDGTVSYSHHHRGTCSHHGGVEQWEDQ